MAERAPEQDTVRPERPVEPKTGRFRLIRRLGSGGAADVFLAAAKGPGGFSKLVVLKTPRPNHLEGGGRNMFLHEARIAARLNHPNCAQVIGLEEIDGLPVIVFEYLEGCTLAAIRQESALKVPLSVELAVLQGTLRGLHHAHQLRDFDGEALDVVHRDVSPQNILVTYDGEVKVLDFGIAKASRQLEQTEVGVIKGKLRYMAPEQVANSPVDARTDVFAAGVLLWEALTQQRLWAGLPDSKLLVNAMAGAIPKLADVAPEAPRALVEICEKATAVEPGARFSSAEEMAATIEAARRSLQLDGGREELASYLDQHFRETRRTVQAQIEGELADAAFHSQEDERSSDKLAVKASHPVSMAPELGEAPSLDENTETAQVPTASEPPPVQSAPQPSPQTRNIWVGAIFGFLACAVLLLGLAKMRRMPEEEVTAPLVGASDRGTTTTVAETNEPPQLPQPMMPVAEPRSPPASSGPAPTASSRSGATGKKTAPAVRSMPPAASALPAASAVPTEPAPACEPPFEITPDGFKRYKLECLPHSSAGHEE